MQINKKIMSKAASQLHRDLGNLRDFPLAFRNTIGSLYYEYWWFQANDTSSIGNSSWTRLPLTLMSHYEMVPDLVRKMRETRQESKLAFEMMVGTTRDLLRYDYKDVTNKSAARRAIERAFKKPHYEVPNIYFLIEQEIKKMETEHSSSVKLNDVTQSPTHSQVKAEQPNIAFIGQLPHFEHNQTLRTFQHHTFLVKYYKNPKSYGEVVADITSPYNYEHVAVIEEHREPLLIIRTEESKFGKFICSFSRYGEHRNFGEFLHDDEANFLSEVVEKLSTIDFKQLKASKAYAKARTIVKCPSCESLYRVPQGKTGKVRCTKCGQLFKVQT